MSNRSTDDLEPLVVTVAQALKLLGVSNVCFYTRILPELDSYKVGRMRRVTLKSVRDYVARHVAESQGKRRRGRPRKAQPGVQPEAVA